MTRPRTHRMVLGALATSLCAGIALGAPGVAFADSSTPAPAGSGSGSSTDAAPSSPACTPSTFSQAQQAVETALADRVTQLNTLAGRVNAASALTAGDKSTLLSDVNVTELPGIQALQTKVPTDTTCPQLRQDAHSMVFDYRVYVVMTPQTDLVIANDTAVSVVSSFAALEPTIAGWIQYAQGHGNKNVADAQAAFADYQAKVTAAGSLATASQSATLLAQNAAGYPGDESVFLQARTNLSNAHNDLYTARADLAKIITDLA